MNFNPIDRKVIKCDLCDGDPQCVRFCDVKAVDFVEPQRVGQIKSRTAARRVRTADKRAAAIHSYILIGHPFYLPGDLHAGELFPINHFSCHVE